MNAMGHDVPTQIGIDPKSHMKKVRRVQPEFMAMGHAGMAEMGSMEMPLPDNTIPMMTGWAQFGPVEMGGMFSVVKVREGLAADDYSDPGWFKHPEGTVAYEWTGDVPAPVRANNAQTQHPVRQASVDLKPQ